MVEITRQFTDEDFSYFMQCVKRERKMPQTQLEVDGTPQLDENDKPVMVNQYTDLEWVTKLETDYFRRLAIKGKQNLILDGNPIDTERVDGIINNL